MNLEKEHQKHREMWNRVLSKRAEAPPKFRFQSDFYRRYGNRIMEPILDIGCGTGEFLEFLLSENLIDVYGIDISDAAVDLTRNRLRPLLGEEVKIKVIRGDMISISDHYPAGYFRTIICEGTFHQTTFTGALLTAKEIHAVASDDALIYVSVRSDKTLPNGAIPVEDERETYRLEEEEGVVRCYFSKEGIVSVFKDFFSILEIEEGELLMRLGSNPYKMWILVLKK